MESEVLDHGWIWRMYLIQGHSPPCEKSYIEGERPSLLFKWVSSLHKLTSWNIYCRYTIVSLEMALKAAMWEIILVALHLYSMLFKKRSCLSQNIQKLVMQNDLISRFRAWIEKDQQIRKKEFWEKIVCRPIWVINNEDICIACQCSAESTYHKWVPITRPSRMA